MNRLVPGLLLQYMKDATVVFPHQLFKKHPAVKKERPVFLVEEELFFNQFLFHKKKLVLHRASMKAYQHFLEAQGITVHYIEARKKEAAVTQLIAHLHQKKYTHVYCAEVADDWLDRRLNKATAAHNLPVQYLTTPQFLNTPQQGDDYFAGRKKYFQTDFYIQQRKDRNLLLEGPNQPLGGRWTFDVDNRKRMPAGAKVPAIDLPKQNKWVTEAIQYVSTHFKENYGTLDPPLGKKTGFYPTTFAEAEAWLQQFLKERFRLFGDYEDAMVRGEAMLYHSGISLLLNNGLLTPAQVVEEVLQAATEYAVPINALEGYIRQVVGWREYIRILYEREGRTQRTTNYWGFTRKIPKQFWTGETGIEPVDVVIKKTLENGYAHHIERLMVMGNFMLLCEFDPDEVYRWFMEMYVDAYDWVMVPNTYGMTQFADGGLMMTKPYISGSNYLMKMGNWQKGPWQAVWDGLFWRFMHRQRKFFSQNARLGMLLRSFDNMHNDKQAAHLKAADEFLKQLDEWNKK